MNCYLITYDVRDDKTRTKLASLLEDYGQRVQYSVFEIWLSEKQMQTLHSTIKDLLADLDGQVRFYRLCSNCQATVQIIGGDNPPQAPDVRIF